jgi:hypothetical protein
MKEAQVDTLDGLEEFINPYGFASYSRGQVADRRHIPSLAFERKL